MTRRWIPVQPDMARANGYPPEVLTPDLCGDASYSWEPGCGPPGVFITIGPDLRPTYRGGDGFTYQLLIPSESP